MILRVFLISKITWENYFITLKILKNPLSTMKWLEKLKLEIMMTV